MSVITQENTQAKALSAFGDMQGVGPNMAMHLWGIGMRSKADIALSDPLDMYERDCKQSGEQLDRCVLYVYRCVVAVCQNEHAKANGNASDLVPALHQWWNWSDKNIAKRSQGS